MEINFALKTAMRKGLDKALLQHVQLRAYAESAAIRGCQTKMLLGRACAENIQLEEADIAEAVRRVKEEFAFVGITSRWRASVCLFHRMYRKLSDSTWGEAVPAELINSRPGLGTTVEEWGAESGQVAEVATRALKRQQTAYLQQIGYADNADDAVYRAALELFTTRAHALGCIDQR
jgi:hypothetical protein